MNSPETSVVITTYNRPDRIPGALETVLNQSYQNFEVIVVDGACSSENKRKVARYKRYAPNTIKYLPVEPEAVDYVSYKGIQHSRNVGCKAAKGKFVAMLDDDDSWEIDKLKKQIKKIKEKPKIGIVLCHTKILTEDGSFIDRTKEIPTYIDLLKSFNLSSTSSYLIRRELLEQVGYWNEDLRGMHEYDIALKITKLGYDIYTIPEPLMIRNRISNITIESGHYYFFKIAEIFDLWKYYGKDFISKIGVKGFLLNAMKTILLVSLFSFGYIVKEKIWRIIYPLKKLYERLVS